MQDAANRLYVLRHAHSSRALAGQRDHERPLDERGRRDAPRLGLEIRRAGYRVDVVVCSTAARAQETLGGIRGHLPEGWRLELSDDLYALGLDAYYGRVRAQAAAGAVMLIGHNPMIEDFTLELAPTGEAEALRAIKAGFPTAGLAVVDVAAPLAEIAAGAGVLRRLVSPASLGDA